MSRPLLYLLSTVVLLFGFSSVFAQDYPMLHFTTEEGLPSNNVYEVYRDSKGFLWFSTDKGIIKYNGIKFEKFTTFSGLPDNEIFFFQEDSYGRLWLGTYNGELCFYKDDTFHTAANTPFLRMPFKISFVRSIRIEKDKTITILFNENSIFLNINKDEINYFNTDNIYLQNKLSLNVSRIAKLPEVGYEIFGNDSNIYINNSFEIVKKEKSPYNNLKCFPCQNKLYYANDKYILSENLSVLGNFRKYPMDISSIHRLYWDNTNIFCAYDDGLIINDGIRILAGNNVSSVTQDNIGNYWVSTLNNGVYCLNKDFFNTKIKRNLYSSTVEYSCVRNNRLFFTTALNNLYEFERDTAKCLFDYRPYKKQEYKLASEPGYLLDSNYKYYVFYNDEHITIDNVLATSKVVKKYANNTLQSNIKHVLSVGDNIYLQNRVWIMELDYKKINEGEEIRTHFANVFNNIPNPDRIFCMAQAPDKSIWYSTINNFYKIVGGKSQLQKQFSRIAFKNFNFYGRYLIGYTHNNRLLMYGNIDKNIWVDSVPQQNCIWDKFYQLDSTHILVSTDNLYRILTINDVVSGARLSVSVVEDPFVPLQSESICADAVNCYFFKNGSVTSISIKSLLSKADPPKLFFASLRTSERSYTIQNEMQIPFRESKNMSISISTLSWGGRDISYQYSVSKNEQDNWRDVKGEEINFVNPGYGKYIVKVKAKTISSTYGVPIVFRLAVLRPLWARWWFIALAVCATVALVGSVIRYRIAYLVRKKEKEHNTELKFMRSEYKALNALMNPHFIFNTLNNVQGLVNRNDKLAANEYLRVFADLIRQNMHNISKGLISLQKEMDLVSNYLLLEKLRFKNVLNYRIDIGDDLDLSDIMVPPLLVQPLVENSIKHGILPMESSEGWILISIYEKNGTLYIEVRDNGAGISASENKEGPLHESFGLENIRKRIEQLSIIQNKKISLFMSELNEDRGKTRWTVVTISMPISS